MSSQPLDENDPPPIPQIGALLRFNSFLPEADPQRHYGNRDWDLEGGAILVGDDHVLTVGHVLQTMPKEVAVFIPGYGIVPLKIKEEEVIWEHEGANEDLDWLVLLQLTSRITGLAPLRYRYLSRQSPGLQQISTYGWGDWRGDEKDHRYFADGIQRCRSFDLLDPEKYWYSPLDLAWASRSLKSPFALRNNSGGAVLGRDEHGDSVLVGVMRAFKGDRHYASRIGTERRDWLLETLGPESPTPPSTSELPSIRFAAPESIVVPERPCVTSRFALPDGTRKVRVTVSASAGLFVQMGLQPSPWDEAACKRLGEEDLCSGRFLCRDLEVSAKDREVHVAVAALAGGPEWRNEVEVQICAACYP